MILLLLPAADSAERIVSLYPGHSDNIVALGAANKLVAISRNDDKDLLPDLPRFTAKSGAEEILALKPDLVLTRGLAERQNPQLRDVLERAGVKVVSLEPPQWNDFAAYLKELASLIGSNPAEAEKKLETIRSTIAAEVKERSQGKSPSVFVEATAKELHTCSPDSWAANLVMLAGGKNAAADAIPARKGSAVAPYGLERILKAAADGKIDIYIIQQGAMNASDLDVLKSRTWYPAIKNIKCAAMPERELSRPSLLGLESGGHRLIKIFYGE